MYIYKAFNLKERSLFLFLIIILIRTHFSEWVFLWLVLKIKINLLVYVKLFYIFAKEII